MDPLETELEYFNAHRTEWLQHYEGKVVLVKDTELRGVFDSENQAYEEGVKTFGNVPFLIKRVLREDLVEAIPALNLGILSASL